MYTRNNGPIIVENQDEQTPQPVARNGARASRPRPLALGPDSFLTAREVRESLRRKKDDVRRFLVIFRRHLDVLARAANAVPVGQRLAAVAAVGSSWSTSTCRFG